MSIGFRLILLIEAVTCGLVLLILFVARIYPPVAVTAAMILIMTMTGLLIEVRFPSVLPRLAIVLYWLPFSATAGFLFDANFLWWIGPSAAGIIEQRRVNEIMLLVGAIGLAGLLTGIAAVSLLRERPATAAIPRAKRTLGAVSFVALVVLSIFLSWLSAPTQTIFAAQYASDGTQDIASSVNFNAAYLASYIVMILLFIDTEREPRTWLRRMKRTAVVGSTLFIVIVLQVLRGDRESMGLIVALMALYLTGPDMKRHRANFAKIARRRVFKVAIPAAAIVLGFMALGAARSLLSPEWRHEFSARTILQSGFAQNTWTAVLLTNLSLAEQYSDGEMNYLYGRTYVDYALSLPPGMITRLAGIQRPLESNRGPAQWFRGVSMGGIHIALVPFRNFGPAGLLIVMAMIGAAIALLEIHRDSGVLWRLLYGAVIACSFFWFWYGDMNLIRAVLIALMLAVAYRTWLAIAVPATASAPITLQGQHS